MGLLDEIPEDLGETKFGSLAMYEDEPEERLSSEDDDVSEESDENDEEAEEEVCDTDAEEDDSSSDDLALALEAARQEALAAQQRAALVEEQLSHISHLLQRPQHGVPYDSLDEASLEYWDNEAARRGSDPRTEYRLFQDRAEQAEAHAAATLGDNIRGYFNGHDDFAEYGEAVLKMLEADPVPLTPYLPPQHSLRDAAWRIDAMFAKAKLERLKAAKIDAATQRAHERTAAQRSKMKAATRGEPTRQAGINMGAGESKSSRRTPADEIKLGVRHAARSAGSLLDF